MCFLESEKTKLFVGRSKEIDRLKDRLEYVKTNGSSALFIKGEDGIGKTSLVMGFKEHAVQQGFDFLVGTAFYETTEPYFPFRTALKDHLKNDGPENKPSSGIHGMIVVRTEKPENKRMFDENRNFAYYKTAETINGIAEEKPLVMFLEDMHRADVATLHLLHFLVEKLKNTPILFIISYRPDEIDKNHPLEDVRRRLSKSGLCDEIELSPLDPKGTGEMLNSMLGNNVPKSFIGLIYKKTQGNPLFIKEWVRKMVEENIIDPEKNRYASSVEKVRIPEVLRQNVIRKIKSLDKKTKRTLEMGCVIGERIPFEILHGLSHMEEMELVEQIDDLIHLDIWHEDPKEEVLYFSHNMDHLIIYSMISSLKKKKYHGMIAKQIEEIYADELEDQFSFLGYHYKQANDRSNALKYYVKGGEYAEKLYAHEDAIEHYKEALELSSQGDILREKILEDMGDAYSVIGSYDEAHQVLMQACEETDDASILQRLYGKIASVFHDKGAYEKGMEFCERGLSLEVDDDHERCHILAKKGLLLKRLGEFDEAIRVTNKAKELAEELDDDRERCQILNVLGLTYYEKGSFDEAKDALMAAMELCEEIQDIYVLTGTLNNLGLLYYEKGDSDSALKYYKESLEYSEKTGRRLNTSMVIGNMALIYIDKGELDKARDYLERSLVIRDEIGDKLGLAIGQHNLGLVHMEKEDITNAKQNLKQSLELAEEIGGDRLAIHNVCSLALISIKSGDLEKAKADVETSLKTAEDLGARCEVGMCHQRLGMVFRAEERWDEAEIEFDRALQILKDIGDTGRIPYVHLEFGRMWKDKGDLERAREHLEISRRMYEELGRPTDEVEEALSSLQG